MAHPRIFDPQGGVTSPRGFRAAGVSAGIKKNGNPDVAIVVASNVGAAAAVFTTNKAQAAPVLVSIEHLKTSGRRAKAVVVNAGCANACTGAQGMADAREMASLTAAAVGCQPSEVLVASTGVIGVNLPMDKVRAGMSSAAKALSTGGGADATNAIMTTDPFPKSCSITLLGKYSIGGMCKGSGMIEPRMATMLGFLTTDAKVSSDVLQAALVKVTNATFNAITVDGECSTNDCVFVLASGESGVEIKSADDPDFIGALTDVCGFLAREIVRGGEGATKLVTVRVTNAKTHDDAWLAVRTVCNSPLVKTAIHGGDPNWGRLVAAAGRSGAAFDISHTSVSIGPHRVFSRGVPHDDLSPKAAGELKKNEMTIVIDLGFADGYDATMWTCDFSAEYVKINAEYLYVKKDFLSVLDLTHAELDDTLALAATLKKDRHAGRASAQPLAGRHVALLFDKPSLRTKSTFTIAVRELGGDVIDPAAEVALGSRETVTDVARNLERWVSGAVVRTFAQAKLVEFANAAPQLRVVNALTDEEHPCQAIADVLTLREHLGDLDGKIVTFVGDGNNVAASLAHAAVMVGMIVRVASPKGYELPDHVIADCMKIARGKGAVEISNHAKAAVAGADAIYTDVWASMGQERQTARREKIFKSFQVNDALMSAAGGAIFLHCLPAHRGHEVTDSVLDSTASVVFDQSENRLHAQKALLAKLFTEDLPHRP